MKIIKVALLAPEQMNPQVKEQIHGIDALLVQLNGDLSRGKLDRIDQIVQSISGLNQLLEQNPDTRFAPMKSHSGQLVSLLNILKDKSAQGVLGQQDIQTVLESIQRYRTDLSGVV
jgi:hypothetical protein